MNLKQIETFIWVATLGSFQKTAKKLNTTQPAITARIIGLEQSLNVKLFLENSRCELTPKGIELLPHAQKLLAMAEKFKEKACRASSASGILRIGASETIVHTWLSDFLNEVQKRFPLVDIDLNVDITVNMRNELLEKSLDLGFLMGPISEHSIKNIHLSEFEIIWVCSPEFDLPEGKISIDNILKKTLVTYGRNTRPFTEIESLIKKRKIDAGRLFPSTSLSASLHMILDGFGIGMMPLALVKNHIEQGKLRQIESDWYPSNLKFTASYSQQPHNLLAEKISLIASEVANLYTTNNAKNNI